MLPKRPAQPPKPSPGGAKPQTARLVVPPPKAAPTARLLVPPPAPEADPVEELFPVDPAAETEAVVKPAAAPALHGGIRQEVTSETRVETASESEIDTQLRSLTKRTSLEELARSGKTRNLKTLSERDLKEWIKEALRRVLSSSTSTISAAEQERLLASTRDELTAIMGERQAEAKARADDAHSLATIAAERDALAMRLAAAEAQGGGRVAELERQLATAGARRDALATRVADLEAQLAGAVSRADLANAAPIVDEEVLATMRAALAVAREGQAAAEAERAQLQRTLSRRLVASAEVVAALLAIDRRFYNAAHHSGSMDSNADAEAAFFADEAAASAVVTALERDLTALHERIADTVPEVHEGPDGALAADLRRLEQMEWVQVNDSMVDDLQNQLSEAQAALAAARAAPAAAAGDPADAEALAELRTRLIDRDAQVARLTGERDEAQRVAVLARETVARLLREQDRAATEKGTITSRIAAADRRQSETAQRLADSDRRVQDSEARLAESQRALSAASERAQAAEGRVSAAESQVQAASERAAAQRSELEARVAAAEAASARLAEELARVRAASESVTAERERLGAAAAAAEQRARQAGEALAAAEQRLRQTSEALAAAEQERQRLAAGHNRAEATRQDAEQRVQAAEAARAVIAAERDRLAAALQAAETMRSGGDGRLRVVEAERDALRSERDVARLAAAAAAKRTEAAEQLAKRAAGAQVAKSAAALPVEVEALQNALVRARAVVTDEDGAPREDVSGALASRKPGRWLTAWRDGKGRLKAARSVNDRWVSAGRADGVDAVAGLASEPALLVRGDGAMAAWRDADGHGRLVTLDEAGRVQEAPRDLGPSLGAPGLSRGGGESPAFVVTTDAAGHVLLHGAAGSAPQDLTAALGAPPAAGAAACWHWALEGSRHIAYRDETGAVHEYLELKGRWFHAALSAKTQAPPAAADPVGYAPADHEHVIYLGADGHVHELCFDGREWHHNDLTVAAAAPAAAGRPSGAYIAGRHCVAYRGVDGKAHCLRLRRDWRHHPFNTLGTIADDPQLGSSGREGAVSYRSADGTRRWARFSGDPSAAVVAELPA
jgi:hypothetical protein